MLKMIPRFSESVMDPWGKKFLWDSRDSTTSKYKIEEHIFQGQFELASIHRICLTGRKPANFGLKSDSNHSIKWKCKPATWFIWQSSAWTRKRSREHVFPLPTLCRWMKYLQTPFINYGRFTIWATTASRWSKSAGSTMPTKKKWSQIGLWIKAINLNFERESSWNEETWWNLNGTEVKGRSSWNKRHDTVSLNFKPLINFNGSRFEWNLGHDAGLELTISIPAF